MTTPALLTVAEVAQRLRVTDKLVRRLIARGDLTAIKLSRRTLRVEAASVDAYIDAHRVRRVVVSPRRTEAWN